MNYLKFFTAVFVLLLALVLQFWLGVWDVHANLVFAALMVFVFLFDQAFGEFFIFLLLGVFLVNWQPGPSLDLLAFALIPLVAYGLQNVFHSDMWIGSMASIAIGLALLYIIISPGIVVHSFPVFLIDVIISLIFGELVLWGMAS